MTRRAPRLDGNHAEVVLALTAAGYTTQSLAGLASGCPDLLVGARGVNVLLEIKDGTRSPSERALTDYERKWHKRWTGQVAVVESAEEALIEVERVAKEVRDASAK